MVTELTHWDSFFNKIISFFLYESSIHYLPVLSTYCANIILDINSSGNEFFLFMCAEHLAHYCFIREKKKHKHTIKVLLK